MGFVGRWRGDGRLTWLGDLLCAPMAAQSRSGLALACFVWPWETVKVLSQEFLRQGAAKLGNGMALRVSQRIADGGAVHVAR